jgi:pSer/pThr/pTyr-binding forkhead associated (FHA) protein
MAYLVHKRPDGTIEQWELAHAPLIFGRGTQADVFIADDRISRQHFAVAPRGDRYVVQDLKSTNGTWVNDERVHEVILKPRDRIRAGQTVFFFVLDRPKGLATILDEIEAEGKGLSTVLRELHQPPSA